MEKILASQSFKLIIIPLITTALSMYIKWANRNDKYRSFVKEDLAVGFDIAITALIIYLTEATNLATKTLATASGGLTQELRDKLFSVPWIATGFLLILWVGSNSVRKLGWKNQYELTVFWGIIIPDIIGFSFLILVLQWTGS